MEFTTQRAHNPAYFTLSDRNFLPRTLAMCKSLRYFDSKSPIYYFNTESLSSVELEAFHEIEVQVIPLIDFLDTGLVAHLKETRSFLEFMWTLPSQILNKMWELEEFCTDFTYLDADIYFYDDPSNIWDEIPEKAISIVRHNFSTRLEKIFIDSGEFNVSWVSVPNTPIGRLAASKWAEDCLEICSDKPVFHNGRLVYGDQKYLDYWPELYGSNLHIINHIGAGVAPWNFERYEFSISPPCTVNGKPIIFFHFSSHQFGFLLSRKMGTEYSKVKKYPKLAFKIYECALRESMEILEMRGWKSRYEPLHKRVIANLRRKLNLSETLK